MANQDFIIAFEQSQGLFLTDQPLPGQNGGAVTTLVATEPITSGTLIALRGGNPEKYSVTNAQHLLTFYGIAVNGANAGQSLTLYNQGIVEISGWGLTPGAIYQAGENGQLVIAATPGAAFAHAIGKALTSEKFLISNQSIINQ